jgi:hypothetical protein
MIPSTERSVNNGTKVCNRLAQKYSLSSISLEKTEETAKSRMKNEEHDQESLRKQK